MSKFTTHTTVLVKSKAGAVRRQTFDQNATFARRNFIAEYAAKGWKVTASFHHGTKNEVG